MQTERPKVSVGLPVFNGDPYLESSLDDIVSQTYPNFELVISDNASTDRTEEICRSYAARYPFIRYYRNETNTGGFRNNNRVIDLATGKYFLLTGHDDLRDPEQLTRCVEYLELNPECVLCYVATTYIDGEGKRLEDKEVALNLDSASAAERFREVIRIDHKVEPVYGIIRCDALQNIRFHLFADSDRMFVAELALRGPFRRLPDQLFYRRYHALQSTAVYSSRYERSGWFNPGRKSWFSFPWIRQFAEYLLAVRRSPLDGRPKRQCYRALAAWARKHKRKMWGDIVHSVVQILRPGVRGVRKLLRSQR